MKRFTLIPLLATLLALASCTKTEDAAMPSACGPVMTPAPADEVARLREYITANNIAAEADSRGFFYTIRQSGDTVRPTVCSEVQVNYTGRLTNGSRFDGGSQKTFMLRGLIVGWQQGIPLIGEGGSITLYLPPSLAYGAVAQNGIPANSILIFDIDLLRIE